MTVITAKELLEAGVHFGHQTRRWNPKMRPYIFGARNGVHIIDINQTVQLFEKAYRFIEGAVAQGQSVLFVGTKKQAQVAIEEEATRGGQFFVNNRWIGGTLTNFATIKKSLEKLSSIETMEKDGSFERMTKKEAIKLNRERGRLLKLHAGIKNMRRLPGVIFIVDTKREESAVSEARKQRIPIVGVVDTNGNPEDVDFPIPANDDALRSIRFFTSKIADGCISGTQRREAVTRDEEAAKAAGAAEKKDREVKI
ncbi:MAG: 30S ribosomal protein S2 [Proteobacteria bacterium]|jgi:small subunit ribosomal protein S2|nr:30S ribosomal protein S2 [Pseudomonadota bacterium]